MEINKKNRTELKNFFEANKIPTEQHFADFVDAGINQAEDGIAKMQGSPLALQAEGEAIGTQEILNLFSNFEDSNPGWSLNLNPRVDSEVPESNHPGLNIKDAIGQSRLFIRSEDGSIGIGTIEPEARLTVQGKGDSPLITAVADAEQHSRIFEVTQNAGNGILSLRAGDTQEVIRLSGAKATPSFFLGNVGVGTTNPESDLQVSGENAELKITNTHGGSSTSTRLGLYHSSNDNKAWEFVVKRSPANLEFSPIGNESKKLIMKRDGSIEAPGGILVHRENRSSHLDVNGALYRRQNVVYLTVENGFFIRDAGGNSDNRKFHFDPNNGRLKIGDQNPEAPLSISGSGKETNPNASMHFTNRSILFGGNNSGKHSESAKIIADQDNALKIYGMGTTAGARKVDINAEGGMTVKGPLHLNGYLYNHEPVMFSAYLESNRSGNVGVLDFNSVSNNLGGAFSGGVFTAPVRGVYAFTISLRTSVGSGTLQWRMVLDPANGAANTFVNANNEGEQHEKAWLLLGPNQYRSRTVFTQLNVGDKVSVTQVKSPSNTSIHADNYSSGFEGVLLYALPD
ncbi:MAG: hypothetical protein AAF934_05595 [Bacteroidota bacterium]